MYVLVNGDLGMSIGKTAAQVAHAVARLQPKVEPYSVIVLSATTEQLHNLKQYLDNYKVDNHLYIDEGVNEIDAYSVTALAIAPMTEDLFFLFDGFKLLGGKPWFKR
jgi:peptidyl-tRNA hydrolase